MLTSLWIMLQVPTLCSVLYAISLQISTLFVMAAVRHRVQWKSTAERRVNGRCFYLVPCLNHPIPPSPQQRNTDSSFIFFPTPLPGIPNGLAPLPAHLFLLSSSSLFPRWLATKATKQRESCLHPWHTTDQRVETDVSYCFYLCRLGFIYLGSNRTCNIE